MIYYFVHQNICWKYCIFSANSLSKIGQIVFNFDLEFWYVLDISAYCLCKHVSLSKHIYTGKSLEFKKKIVYEWSKSESSQSEFEDLYITAGIHNIVFGNIHLMMSRDLNIELLPISTDNIWKLCGLELKNILIQQEFNCI